MRQCKTYKGGYNKSFEIRCVSYGHSTPQFRLSTLQVLTATFGWGYHNGQPAFCYRSSYTVSPLAQ